MTAKGASTTRQDLSSILGVSTKASVLKQSLKRLTTRGLIDCVDGPSDGGSSTKHWFACTEEGLKLLSNASQMQGSISREERSSYSSLICSEALVSQEGIGGTGLENRGYSDSLKAPAAQAISHDLGVQGVQGGTERLITQLSVERKSEGGTAQKSESIVPPLNPVIPRDLPRGHNSGKPIGDTNISDESFGSDEDKLEDEIWST